VKRFGFYTTREVEAADPDSAESMALQLMNESSTLRDMVRNSADDPPMLFIEEVVEIESVDSAKPVPGFAFYDDEAEEPAN